MKYIAEQQAADMLGLEVSTLRKWRMFPNRGPRFVKLGNARKSAVRYTAHATRENHSAVWQAAGAAGEVMWTTSCVAGILEEVADKEPS